MRVRRHPLGNVVDVGRSGRSRVVAASSEVGHSTTRLFFVLLKREEVGLVCDVMFKCIGSDCVAGLGPFNLCHWALPVLYRFSRTRVSKHSYVLVASR